MDSIDREQPDEERRTPFADVGRSLDPETHAIYRAVRTGKIRDEHQRARITNVVLRSLAIETKRRFGMSSDELERAIAGEIHDTLHDIADYYDRTVPFELD